ncbi:MAG: chromosome segregation protein SMC [Clostridia bacterium]|nr:chromosome segregation protein SMC [Clostridia bacterium]
MHLKRIELQGFKSFAGKTVLEFDKGITCVVGPNGSGKSNIADAVRWVLGEQSAKQLRGSKMLDVIFAGTQFRKSVGFTEVSLVIDNEDQALPIEYTEVVITRRLYRNGDSEYYINNNTCRLKDITGLFLDTGIGKEGYSIIGQGQIHEILSAKSEDRRGIFEEAAGIMKYKVKKLEAQRKLEKTEENLLRINDIVHELKMQIGPLKEQSIVAKEFLEIRDQLKILEVGLYLNNLNNFKSRIIKYDEDITVFERDIISENNSLEQLRQANIDRNRRIQEIEEQEEAKRNELNEFLMSVETTLHEISIANERINSIDESVKRSREDITEIDDKIKLLNSDYLKREERVLYFKEQYQKYSDLLTEKQKEMDEILKSLGDKEKEIENLKTKIINMQEKVSDIRIHCRTLENENVSLLENLEKYEKELQLEILSKDSMFSQKQEMEREFHQTKNERQTIEEQLADSRKNLQMIQEKQKELRDNLEKSRTKLGILESNLKIVSDMEKRMEGYRHSVKVVMEEATREDSSLSGIYNIFGKLIQVDEKYEVALEAALGGNLQNIVVTNEESAKEAIEFLKSSNNGRATFMPLNSMRRNDISKDLYQKLSHYNGFIDTADKLISYDEVFDDAVSNLLGKIVIVHDFDQAKLMSRNIKGDYKIVTLEGEFFNIGGTITGGSLGKKSGRILGREKEIERLESEIEEEIIKIESVEKEIKETADLESKTGNDIMTIAKSLNDLNEKIIRSESDLNKYQSDFEKLTDRIASIRNNKLTTSEKIQQNNEDIEENRSRQESIENEINMMKANIISFETLHGDERKKRDELHLDLADLKVSVNSASESINNTSDTLNRLETEKNELTIRKGVKSIDIDDLLKKREGLLSEIKIKNETVKNPKETEDKLREKLNHLMKERRAYEDDNTAHMDLVSEVNKNIIDIQNKISRQQVNKAKIESEMEAMQSRMWDEYGLTHNEALEKHHEIENITEARKQIRDGKKRIEELGPVNINAIEDFKKTNERFVFMTEQSEDLEKSKKDLYKIISEMNLVMKKVFIEKFEIINNKFDRVFKELFEGGRARIELVDGDDVLESGVDIIVQPPGKKLQNMMLLSGGEKAFTAIALLFAILELNPSPFCIFDEIEAALDDANVIRFAEYINSYKEKTQFILITHRKGSMEHSDSLYGVTMQEHGVSKVVSMKMSDQEG